MRLQSFLKKYDIAIQSEHDNCENPGLVYQITNKKNGMLNTASWWSSDPMTIQFGANFDNPKKFQLLDSKFTEPILEYTVELQKFRNNKEFFVVCDRIFANNY